MSTSAESARRADSGIPHAQAPIGMGVAHGEMCQTKTRQAPIVERNLAQRICDEFYQTQMAV